MSAAPTILVMGPGSGAEAGAELLGRSRAEALSELLHTRALGAAAAGGPGSVHLACAPGPHAAPEAIAAAVARVWPASGRAGPLLMLWPELPRWRPAYLGAALADLAEGCALTIGPVFDGGFYLLGLARPLPGLFELSAGAWQSPDAMSLTLAIAARDGIETGLLRAERGLRTPADIGAALADPLLDDELREILNR